MSNAELLSSLDNAPDEGIKRAIIWARCATDLELFAYTYFPHYCTLAFNDLHRDVFSVVSFGERSVRRVRAAPRGYAKSTLTALIKPIHDVCYGLEAFIVIFSNTEGQAIQKLRDIRSEILTNARLIADYGIGFESKRPGETNYVVRCGDHRCLFQGYGAATEVRGIRFGAKRPSKVVVDDGEHSEEVLNEAIRTKYEDWMFQVVSKIGDTQTNIEVIGTVLHPESLLKKLLSNPAYESKLYRAVISWSERQNLWDQWTKVYTDLDDAERKERADAFYRANEPAMLQGTRVLWPEKESYLYLMKELIETGRRAFFKEKQNDPIGGDQVLFERFHWYREEPGGLRIESNNVLIPWDRLKDKDGRWLAAHAALDPATGQTKAKAGKTGDYAALMTGLALPTTGRERRNRLLVHHDWVKHAGPSKWISQVFSSHEEFGYQKVAVETNLYRDLLLPNFEAERKVWQEKLKKEIRVPFYDVVNTENKEKRIYTLEPMVTHGWILFNRALSETFRRQMESFPLGDHDDGPDALEMLWGLVNGRYRAAGLTLNQGGR